MARKTFKDNPALQFITATDTERERETTTETTTETPSGYKANPAFVETKSKRVQLLVQPSVFDAVDRIARARGLSRNEIINEALRQYTEREG